jgi:uncharacterized protein (DUF169 family)
MGWLSMACGPLRVHSYLIPSKIEPHWITIEYDNPKCAPLKEGAFGREFVIPESGFLCTSSSMYTGWHREKYYSVDGNNNRTALQTDERIFRRESLAERKFSSDAGMVVCKVTGDEFFYGPKEKLTSENPIMEDENFLTSHPECRHRGITTKPSP